VFGDFEINLHQSHKECVYYDPPMKRSIEILSILKSGIKEMVSKNKALEVKFMRIFNFNESRVSLRMESSNGSGSFVPMGRIDVYELSSEGGSSSCDCILREFNSGKSERIILRLKTADQKLQESRKVFSFFENLLGIDDSQTERKVDVLSIQKNEIDGMSIEPTRGAQAKEDKPND